MNKKIFFCILKVSEEWGRIWIHESEVRIWIPNTGKMVCYIKNTELF
jgi:hypothetical protein